MYKRKWVEKKKKCLRCKTSLEYFSLWQHGVGLAKLHCFETCSRHIVMRVTITTSIFALQAASTELFRSPSSKLASFFSGSCQSLQSQTGLHLYAIHI